MSELTLREAMEAIAEKMGETIDWSQGDIRKYFGGSERHSNVEMEVRIQTDLGTMKVYIQTRITFRQRSIDDAALSVEYAADATEAAALAFAIENDVGAMRWTHEDHQALYKQFSDERTKGEG